MTLAERFKELAGTHTSKGVVWEPAWLKVIYDHLLAEQPDGDEALNEMAQQPADTGAKQDDWLAECAEDWWVHQRGSTDTNRSRWALQYADRLIAAAREGAMQTSQAYEQIVQLNKSLAAKEADLATSKEKLAAATKQADGLKANLAVCDGLKARLEQTTALLIEECDETTKLRAELDAAKVKIADTTRDLDWYMKAYNRERDEVNSLNCANASNLLACDRLEADLAAANERIAEYEKRDIDLAARDKAYRQIERALIAAARRCCG